MAKELVFKLSYFCVTRVSVNEWAPKSRFDVRFRIPRGAINAVKRNMFKRVVREFIRRQMWSVPQELIFHVYKQHLGQGMQWRQFIQGVRYDLAEFAKHLQKYSSHVPKRAPLGCAVST